ncbi:MAG: hypothetical protein JWN80_2688 [Microbacteriaceae bacterium]|jgi:2-dehydropantoate 2-reductase|nr:hypothetical protein [Microbacteriaceae bacterium]
MNGLSVAVVGAGANGASIGADLTNAGITTTLIEQWPAHVERMRESGVTVNMPGRSVNTPVRVLHFCEVATLREQFDIVLLLVKAYDTRWAAQMIEPYLRMDGFMAGVQNGMTIDAISDVVGTPRTIGCVIEISSTMYEPGVVERHSGPDRSWFAVGDAGHDGEGAEQVRGLLAHSGTAELVDDIRSTKWMKLISNATTLAATASVGLSVSDSLKLPELRRFMIQAGQEALDTALATGHSIRPIFGLTERDVEDPATVVETLLDTLVGGFTLPHTTTTVLQDWTKGRRSEVGNVNGYVLEQSAEAGLSAPANQALVDLSREIEQGSISPSLDNLAYLLERRDAPQRRVS